MKKKISVGICIILSLTFLLTACVGKSEQLVYKDGMFNDVTAESPYRDYIAAVYEMGLMKGVSDTAFGTEQSVTMAQAIAYTAKLHSFITGDKYEFKEGSPWYKVYVDYAVSKGILQSKLTDYNGNICRAEFADILVHSLPASALPQINTVEDNAIPDVSIDDEYGSSIYLLYRAGIFTGVGKDGSFLPNDNVSRAEVAQALARMAASNMRGTVTLKVPEVFTPDLTEQAKANDDFFKNAAIVGNSLVEGLRMYSDLSTITYYSGTSMSVVSAMKDEIPNLITKQYGRIYIELGINELGSNADTFKENYGKMLDTIRAAEPDAGIYILSILPVSQSKSDEGQFTIDRVKDFNAKLYELCSEKECYYMDVFSALAGSDGYLPADETWDGVHLTPDTYAIWENYMRTHYAAKK